jgi:NAD(P)-dependent dehydrogenase (short-subunit alcohol dehydrogenase family)
MAVHDFAGRTAFVTGGASGISRAVAIAFAHAGAQVFIVDRNGAGAEATANAIRDAGGHAVSHCADISKAAQVDAAVTQAEEQFGRVDMAFNGAAIGSPIAATIADYDEASWDAVLDVNLRGMFLCLRAQIRQMRKQGSGGSIVAAASIGGVRATPMSPAYIASKHAVIGLVRASALDHASDNIRVNAICPGFIGGTPMMDAFIEKDPAGRLAHINASVPWGRMGTVEEVADVVLWLNSDGARYITGTTLFADGGLTAR